jgi:hypothetical protein
LLGGGSARRRVKIERTEATLAKYEAWEKNGEKKGVTAELTFETRRLLNSYLDEKARREALLAKCADYYNYYAES